MNRRRDLRLLALLPFALLGDVLLTLAERLDTKYADALNDPEEGA